MPDALPAFETWALVFARLAPSGVILALASRGAVPAWIGLGIALAVALGLAAPGAVPFAALGAAQPMLWAFLRELCVGLSFASAAALPFFAIGMGVRLVERSEPHVRAPLATLYGLAAVALTVSLGGLRAYVRALSDSLVLVPLATSSLHRAQLLVETQWIVVQALTAALSLGLPLLIAVWLLDLSLALVLRLAQEGTKVDRLPVRRALVLLLLVLAFAPWVSRAPELARAALVDARAATSRSTR